MLRRSPTLLAGSLIVVLLAGCDRSPAETATPAAANVSAKPAAEDVSLTAVTTLAGEWRVAGIDGQPLDEPYGIPLSATHKEIWWNPRCALGAIHYIIRGKTIVTGPSSDAQQPRNPPPCLPGLPPRLPDVMRALQSATTIGRTAQNGVLLSGHSHSLLLFSQ